MDMEDEKYMGLVSQMNEEELMYTDLFRLAEVLLGTVEGIRAEVKGSGPGDFTWEVNASLRKLTNEMAEQGKFSLMVYAQAVGLAGLVVGTKTQPVSHPQIGDRIASLLHNPDHPFIQTMLNHYHTGVAVGAAAPKRPGAVPTEMMN